MADPTASDLATLSTAAREPPPEPHPCFADSRRLTGPNLFFDETGAVLETLGPTALSSAAHAAWRERVTALRQALGWPDAPLAARCHAAGAQLALAAPAGQLFTATEVNEWAWEAASGLFAGSAAGTGEAPRFDALHPPGNDLGHAVRLFAARAAAERQPAWSALAVAAREHGVALFADDAALSLGAGKGSRTWPLSALPDPRRLRWSALHDVPTALVTGSNGKTTTVRLIAAMLAAAGRVPGHCGTEGVVVGAAQIASGDYSGPAGARLVLRHSLVEAAVLETARGGILRRGLATGRADVAVVTNLSADHFGEYGIDNLDDLADTKLVVARALGSGGLLVLNADDPLLLVRASLQRCRVALFSLDGDHRALAALRAARGMTCGVAAGRLRLSRQADVHDLVTLPRCRSPTQAQRSTTSPMPPRPLSRLWNSASRRPRSPRR